MAPKPKYATREQWLHAVKDQLAPVFKQHGATIPARVRLTCGFPTRGALSRGTFVAGQCFDIGERKDSAWEISVTPRLDDPVNVGAVLVHELCHACVGGTKEGHGPVFSKLAKAMGLVGKMTNTTAGSELKRTLAAIVDRVGPYPHASLLPSDKEKKQSTRLIKAACETCGYTVRVTRKWLDQSGTPLCPEGHGAMLADDPEDGGDE